MKTLINKRNSQIRITAPEIIRWFSDFYVVKAEAGKRKGRILVVKSKDWTLVEEEPVGLDLVKKIISTYKSIVHREEEAAIEWYMDDNNTGISYKEMTPEEIYKEVYKNINK